MSASGGVSGVCACYTCSTAGKTALGGGYHIGEPGYATASASFPLYSSAASEPVGWRVHFADVVNTAVVVDVSVHVTRACAGP